MPLARQTVYLATVVKCGHQESAQMGCTKPVGNELTVNPLDGRRECISPWSRVDSARQARISECGMLLR